MATNIADAVGPFEAALGEMTAQGLLPVSSATTQPPPANPATGPRCDGAAAGVPPFGAEPAGAADGAPARAQGGINRREARARPLDLVDADALAPAAILKIFMLYGERTAQLDGMAERLLGRFGSLGAVLAAESIRLRETSGLEDSSIALFKTVQAAIKRVVREPIEDRPVIGSGAALMDYLSVTMRHDTVESLRVLFLDRKNALIKDEVLQRGTVHHVPLYPREVAKRALELGASALIMVHNHPSGDPTPSRADIDMTRQVVDALKAVDVVVHDHVIVGRNTEASLRKLGLM